MAGTVKILSKLCGQIQAGSTYESGAMFGLPFMSNRVNTTYDPINDEAVSGEGFMDVPQQGPRHVGVSGMSLQLDIVSCLTIFEAAFGNVSTQIFTMGSNSKKMSMCMLDYVNAVKYANAYLNNLTISGSSGEKISLSADFIMATAEDRAATGDYPSATGFGEPFTFHEAGGTNGYIRVGNADDALAAGDNVKLEDWSLSIGNSFAEQYTNDGVGTETPLFGQGGFPTIEGSFTVATHDTEQYQTWQEDHTPLQMSILLYKSATAQILLEIPRFIVEVNLTDDDKTKVSCSMKIGRNGSGTSYVNSNMAFTSPIRATVTNS